MSRGPLHTALKERQSLGRRTVYGSALAVMLLSASVSTGRADPQGPEPASSESPQRPFAKLLNLPVSASALGAAYYTPTQDHREIDVTALDFTRSWRVVNAFELQRRLTLFHASGKRSDVPFGVDPDSTATGVAFGFGGRLYPLYLPASPAKVFVEASAQVLYTPTKEEFPPGGTGLNGFLRAGGGVLFQIRPRLAIEASYQWYSHVSNASGLSPQNPMWNGHGGTLTLRRSL
jgi:hypothetical protein